MRVVASGISAMTPGRSGQTESGTDGVTWYCDTEEYKAATHEPRTDHAVPVLVPADPRKAKLWREVFRRQFVRRDNPESGTRAILAWGEAAAAPARILGHHLGATPVTCAGRTAVVEALRHASEQDVIVVGLADQFGGTDLAALYTVAAEMGKILGIVCGRTESELSFAVAKTALRPYFHDASAIELFDAPEHREENNPHRPPGGLIEDLLRPSAVKVLRSHGEGGHAKFPDVVICGLLDDVEFPHAPGDGCARTERRCKRAVHRQSSEVLFADELPANLVCFVCCNGFTVAGELYPSPVSMALSFVEGWAGAVIAPSRPLVAPDGLVQTLIADLTAARPLGEVVARLNRMSDHLGQPAAFVLHGDPRLRQTDLEGSDAVRDTGTTAASRMLGAPDDRDPDLEELSTWLAQMRRRADAGRRLERTITTWLGGAAGEVLDPVRAGLTKIESLVLHALKWAESKPAGAARSRLLRSRALVTLAVAAWDRQVARLLLDLRDRLDVFDVGHYDQLRISVAEEAVCHRCASPAEVHRFGAGDPVREQRVATLCRVCGPISEHRGAGLALHTVEHQRRGRPGDIFTWRVHVEVPADQAPVTGVQLYLRFIDKATDTEVWSEARGILAENQDVDFSFTLPVDLSADLHSIRLVALSGLDLAYARIRFAGVPAATAAHQGGAHAR